MALKQKKAPTGKGRGEKTACCGSGIQQTAHRATQRNEASRLSAKRKGPQKGSAGYTQQQHDYSILG